MRTTMDRYESDWGVVKNGWDAHVNGIPESFTNYPGYFKSAEAGASIPAHGTDQRGSGGG